MPRRKHRNLLRQWQPSRGPRPDPAVEHSHRAMPQVVEHPPEPGRDPPAEIVIPDDRVLVPDPDLLQPPTEYPWIRQRMPAGPRRRCQVAIDVEMQRAGQVARFVRQASLAGLAEIPATVDHAEQGVVDRGCQGRYVDQRTAEPDRHCRKLHRSGVRPIGMAARGSPEPSAGRSRPVMQSRYHGDHVREPASYSAYDLPNGASSSGLVDVNCAASWSDGS